MRIVNPQEYISSPRPGIKWLVDGLIPKPCYLMLMGPPKHGKSFIAWDIASRVAKGESVMGYSMSNGPQKVLYLQLDTPEVLWTDRLKTFAACGVDLNIPNLMMIHPADLQLPLLVTDARGKLDMRKAIEQSQCDMLVIDVLREIHQEDENDSTSMKVVFDALAPLTKDISVLLLHHTRKP